MNKTIKFLTTLLLLAVSVGAWADDTYVKVTSTDDLVAGAEYLLVNENNDETSRYHYVMGSISNTSTKYGTKVDVAKPEISGTLVIGTSDNVNVLTLGGETDKWTFKTSKENAYLYWSSGNSLATATTVSNKSQWKVSFSGTTLYISNVGTTSRHIKYNISSPRFACYESGQSSVCLYKKQENSNKPATPTFSPTIGTTFGNDGLDVTISQSENIPVYYNINSDEDPTSSSTLYTGSIHITETSTIKAVALDETEYSNVATATYTYVDPNAPGTESNPYTVAQARAAIDAGSGTSNVYATGIVSAIPTAYSTQYNNITFNFVDEEGDTEFLQAFRCEGDEAANVQVGDTVVVYGDLTKYGSTYEFGQGCQLVSLTHPSIPVISANNVELAYDATSGEIAYTIINPVENTPLSATTDANWISNITVGETSVTFSTTVNDGNEDREATITLSYTGAQDKTVTVTQKHFVADYATLPFEYDGNGNGTLPQGFTVSGLGTYNSSPAMKFDGTGDYAILKFNERPGVLSFDIKNNSFSGGTFTVQTSEDGETYTNLKAYTEISGTQNETFNNLGENVRYIKWIYTNKSSGNVALGNIKLEKYVEPSNNPVITLDPYTVNVEAAENEGTIAISYNNFGLLDVGDFDIQYYDAVGVEILEPDWIVADVEQSQGGDFVVSYVVEANDGAARTAYFKVYAMDDNGNYVYSDLVTITQAAYVAPVEGATFTLAHSVTPGKEYIIVSEENLGEAYAMGAQNDNNRAAVEVNVDNNNIEVTSSDVRVFVIEADGDNYTIYDAVEGGYLYAASSSKNYLKTKTELDENGNATWSIEIDEDGAATITAQGANTRNTMRYNSGSSLFSCYAPENNQQPVYLYEKVEATPEYVTVSISSAGMATLSSNKALDFTNVTTIQAYYATLDNSGNVAYHRIRKVPAETGLLIRNAAGEAQGAVSADVPTLTETAESVEGNILVAALEAITGLQSESDGYKNYILNKHSQYGLGFYLANGKNLAANRAYMRIPVQTAREFIGINFDGDATGIESIRLNGTDDAIYDLQGRKVMNPAKGLYIVNGKKVVVK